MHNLNFVFNFTLLLCIMLSTLLTRTVFCLVLDQAFVTLATNDSYALGALVLAHSLKLVGTARSLVVMVTQDVSESLR